MKGWKLVPVEPTREMWEAADSLTITDWWASMLAAAPQPPVGGDVEWSYCPECGSDEINHAEAEHKQCANCHQEWFSDIDYSDTVRHHLGGHYGNWKFRVTACDQQIAALQARIAVLQSALEGMVEYFPEGHSDGECFSAEVAKAALTQQVTQ